MHFNFELEREAGGGLIMNMVGYFPFEAANTDPQCRDWLLDESGSFNRGDDMLQQGFEALGFTAQQIDEFFTAAALL
jgi:hypothetical protein